MEKKLTGYEIKKTMEKSTNHFFNTSYGSIYPALKKLEQAGHLISSEEINNGKLNKFYTITESGKAQFREWMAQNSSIAMIRDEALCRMFFFSLLENDEIERQLASYFDELTAQINMMLGLQAKYAEYDIDPWKMKTLYFVIDYYLHMKESYSKILNDFRKKTDEIQK
jgi:DNA-binding PadR family transcriptional regulator